MDAGDIILQEEVVNEDDNYETLSNKIIFRLEHY